MTLVCPVALAITDQRIQVHPSSGECGAKGEGAPTAPEIRAPTFKRVVCTEPAIGSDKRTRTNDNELRRMNCCYPLRFDQKPAFKQALGNG